MKFLFSIIAFLFICPLILKAQEIEVCEYSYSLTTINNGDTSNDEYTVLVARSKILEYKGSITEDNYSLTDFDLGKRIIVHNGRKSSLFNISLDRKNNYESHKNTDYSVKAQTLMQVKDTSYANQYTDYNTYFVDILYIDTTLKIPYYKNGGFSSWLDSGLGFLSSKFIREISSEKDYSIKKIIFTLTSRKKTKINKKYFDF